jgi:hypothetical protein
MAYDQAAGAGEMLNIHDLKAACEKEIGHATSDSTIYNLLHRHGSQDVFKKTAQPRSESVLLSTAPRRLPPSAIISG